MYKNNIIKNDSDYEHVITFIEHIITYYSVIFSKN